MRDCFRGVRPEGTLSLPPPYGPPLVDCVPWISGNKGVISGALVPTRAGANYECVGDRAGEVRVGRRVIQGPIGAA